MAADQLFQQLKNSLSQINGLYFWNSQQISMFIGITNVNTIRIIDTEKNWKFLIIVESADLATVNWRLAEFGDT